VLGVSTSVHRTKPKLRGSSEGRSASASGRCWGGVALGGAPLDRSPSKVSVWELVAAGIHLEGAILVSGSDDLAEICGEKL
jgi:hypothetical protein